MVQAQVRQVTTHIDKTVDNMTIRRTSIVLGTMVGLCATVAAFLYFCTIHKQHEGIAFLKALSDVKIGATTKDEFTKEMTRFKNFESPSMLSSCYDKQCYKGVGYGLDNSTLGRYTLFPATNLAAGVFFDSNNIVQGSMVTLDRIGIASATMEESLEVTPKTSTKAGPWSGGTQQIHLVLDGAHRQDLTHLSVSCFTSWFGCDTALKLVSSGD
jgi:hypothetical protein